MKCSTAGGTVYPLPDVQLVGHSGKNRMPGRG